MREVGTLLQHGVPPDNEQLAAFIAESDVPEALAGEIPLLQRRFAVQVAKDMADRSVSAAEFERFTAGFATDIEQSFEKFRQSGLADMMADVSRGISDQFDMEFMIEVGGLVPLPPHHADEHSLASSLIASNEYTFADGEALSEVITATMTFVRVRGRVLFVYANGERDDLNWTREASAQWVQQILAANPGGDVSGRSSPGRGSRGTEINWDRVAGKAIGGAFLALVVLLVSGLFRGRKRS